MAQYEKDIEQIDSEVLQTRISDLEKQQEENRVDYEAKLKEAHLSSALKMAIFNKVHDVDMTLDFIDKSAIEVDPNGKVLSGLDEQITSLQESKSFLFVPEKEEKPPVIKGVDQRDHTKSVKTDLGAKFAKLANDRDNPSTLRR